MENLPTENIITNTNEPNTTTNTNNATNNININEIFENAQKDPSLFSTMDINMLLSLIENEKNDYLENKTMKDITEEIYTKISKICLPSDRETMCNKLIGYRYVDEIHELHKGKHVRWIRMTNHDNMPARLTNGGIVVDIKFLDNGTHVLCKNSRHQFIQYKFDDCYTFQKLSVEEQLILMAYDYSEKL